MKLQIKLLIISAVLVSIWFLPVPEGVEPEGIHLLAIFAATIIGLILTPVPMGAVTFISIVMVAASNTLPLKVALSGFSNSTIWLIVAAFLFTRGFIKTGLGKRIAYMFIKLFGKKTLGLSYSLILSEFVLSPALPSNTARGGGIFYPIVRSLSSAFGSEPEKSPRKIGSFLMLAQYHSNVIISAMFLTAMVANPVSAEFAKGISGVEIQWSTWALGALVPGIISLAVIPYTIYKLVPPQIKESSRSKQIALEELEKMGTLKRAEKILTGIFLCTLLLWTTSSFHNIHTTTVALSGVVLMLITGVIDWSDILSEKGAWNALIWFGGLVMMAAGLSELGVIAWFGDTVSEYVQNFSAVTAFIILLLVYFYVHYAFASMTAHITALFPVFFTVALTVGIPPLVAGLALAYFSNLCACLTQYATGPAPIYFGSGYVDQVTWWKVGFIISLITIVIWIGMGFPYWKLCGLW
ncbi:anion permease [candidate division KSB1 bacterium]